MANSINKLQHVKKKTKAKDFKLLLSIIFGLVIIINNIKMIEAFCRYNEFECHDGSCILHEKMCDGRRDCKDNTDELNCDSQMCQKPNWFQCHPHGPCLATDLICDNIDNCPNGEDERDCITSTKKLSTDVGAGGWHGPTKRICTKYEYTCQNDKNCIPLDFMCDGHRDCYDGSDELNGCDKAKSTCTGFFCNNRKCLESKKWICDGVDDCGDGSDEQNCVNFCTPEFDKFLCNDKKTCLNLTMACNDKIDCPDRSDEALNCKSMHNNCALKQCPPASKCHMIPNSEPLCICPKGYRYSKMQNICIDINECDENYDACSQSCENTPGSYKCKCNEFYALRNDNKSCEAVGEEALLLYTTQLKIMGVHLHTKRVYTIARNLTKVIGVAFDGYNIFWTNIEEENESIVKSSADGQSTEILLTSGLDSPEDLAVDWFTGNIYFSDNAMRHIAVCTNNGLYCTVLATAGVHQPRGIALWPERAQIFWTDWGNKPSITRASMDGRHQMTIIDKNIHWPNGITIDEHNNRIYWTDAKKSTIESIRPDGTDRRVVIDEILKHPYGIAIFENNIYWTDWDTKSLHSCNKFNGKDHKIVTKDRTMYSVHIFHLANKLKKHNACLNARCSHICLLSEGNTFSCACPDGMQLAADQLRCIQMQKQQRLLIGVSNSLLEMEHTTFGRHIISHNHQLPAQIDQMVYNSINGTVIFADNMQRKIYQFDSVTKYLEVIVSERIGNITSIAFDYLAYNIYWCDSERHVVEVFSLQTHHRAIVKFFSGTDAPTALSLMPEEGFMLVALRSSRHVHIDKLPLDGRTDYTHVFEEDIGDDDIEFVTDYSSHTLYWSDSELGRISFTDYNNLYAYIFRNNLKRPYSLAIVDDDLFWSELNSPTIRWTHKTNMGSKKRIDIEMLNDTMPNRLPQRMQLVGTKQAAYIEHPCQQFNGGCSHVCVTQNIRSHKCLCPSGLLYKDATNRTCIDSFDCEFRCKSGECLTMSRRCNGRDDCSDGSDEQNCDESGHTKLHAYCTFNQFGCHNAKECIDREKQCDGRKDCTDGSDEEHCDNFDKNKKCQKKQFACHNGKCIDYSAMCDTINDCGDNSDETNCKTIDDMGEVNRPVCDKDMFQCNTGSCIARSWECDGKIDCTDASDEHDKCKLKDCPKDMHHCLLGQCIDARLVCDNHNDCGDYSDEFNCDYKTGMHTSNRCDADTSFQCASMPVICLDLSAKCNGTAECPRGEDEADCGTICSFYEFKCKETFQCIRQEFRCDHEKDCDDGTDEMNCEQVRNGTTLGIAQSHNAPCKPNMYDCHNGECVDMSSVCNNFEDCDNGADEGLLCKTACKATTSNGKPICEHKCNASPRGATCSCYNGYYLQADQRSCIDINECAELNPCAQHCENTLGSFSCSCYADFMLRTDKTTCKSIESESAVLFSTYNEVRSMTEQPIILRVAWSVNDTEIKGFDVDTRQALAYFTTDTQNALYKVDMNSGQIKVALNIATPSKVAVDWITDNVYVISRTKTYDVKVCSFKVKMCSTVYKPIPPKTIKAIAVDAYNRYLIVVSVTALSFNRPMSEIALLNLDGKHNVKLFDSVGAYITAIATDPYKKMLYYVDFHTKSLNSISYRKGDSNKPIQIVQKGNYLTNPTGISVYENQAFIVNVGSKEAIRCQLFGKYKCKAFNLNILNAEDIVINAVTRQPLNSNPCVHAKCHGICVQAEYSYECMCGDRIVAETETCATDAYTKEIHSSIKNKNDGGNGDDDDEDNDGDDNNDDDDVNDNDDDDDNDGLKHLNIIFIICLLLLLSLAGIAGYWYYQRIRYDHRDFNINLHFHNPLSAFCQKSHGRGNGGSTNFGTGTTTASFEADRERMRFGIPTFPKFLRQTHSNNGSEIMLETSEKPNEIYGYESARRGDQNILVEDDIDDNTSGTLGHYHADDGRTKLVS